MSLQRCKRETTSREFTEWNKWLDEQETKTTADQYYMMQIAMEVKRSQSTHPRKIKLEHFELEFSTSSKEEEKPKLSKEEYTKRSKAFWFALTGYKRQEGE